MKLLACVTTCDRPLLPRNAVESHLQLGQDDMQLVWHDPDVLMRAELVVERRPGAAHVDLTFFEKIVADMPERLELADASGYWAGLADGGLVSLRLVAERGFRLAGTENDTSELCRA